ncbi:MAG: DUF5682 family protein [Actinomycetota bacterium]
MSDRVHLLGIRHHGPGSARSVLTALDRLQPEAVLVEAPADTERALDWIGHDGLVPPIALLGYVVAEPSRVAVAPFATFSPEWQAVSWAHRNGVAVSAIDLPLAVTMSPQPATDVAPQVGVDRPVDPIRQLAEAGGDSDPERWWDDVIEHRGDGEPAFDAVAEAMAAARSGTVTPDDEERREAHMRRAIRRALGEVDGPIAVVCGAWHVPALDVDAHTATADTRTLRGLKKVKVASAWVPWTHRRLASASGYRAGVSSPGWYRHVFTHPGPDGVARFFVDAAHELRERGIDASPDHLIAGTRLADTLAALRDRPRPGLGEVVDAADAVMGGLDVIRDRVVVGDALGSVPSEAPQVPLARDLAAQQRSARLKPSADVATVELDLRTPNGRRRSHLFHRMLAIGVPWAVPEEGRGTSGTFRETWRVAWEPEMSVRLVERAGLGTTVESAATAALTERATGATSLSELVGVLQRGLFAELPAAVAPVVDSLGRRAAADPDVGRLIDVLHPLAAALRYGDVRDTDVESLERVFDGLVIRVAAGLVPACSSLDDDAAMVMVERLTVLQAALATLDHPARRTVVPQVLQELAAHHATRHAAISGRASRLLHDADVWDAGAVERRLSRALSRAMSPASGAAFVEGFLAGSGTVLIHDHALRAVVDRWLSSLTPDSFEGVLPLLRRTFGDFEPAERRRLMTLVVVGRVQQRAVFGADVDPGRSSAALVTVRHALGLAIPATDADWGADGVVTIEPVDDVGHGPVDARAHEPGELLDLPQVSAAERRRRWRLVLGSAAEPAGDLDDASRPPAPTPDETPDVPDDAEGRSAPGATDGEGTGDGDATDGTGAERAADGEPSGDRGDSATGVGEAGAGRLSADDARIDAALGALYDRDGVASERRTSGTRAGGLGRSRPGVVRWLGDIRRYFPTPVVTMLQRDAVERLDLRQLLLEPELLEAVEPDLGLVTLLVELNRSLPDETRATARRVIASVLARIEERLADRTRRAVRGALARSERTRRPQPGDIDWPHTISANLRHWIPEHRTVVPERLIGHGRHQRSLAKDVVIAVDQSGSMAESVVYASLFAGVLAQLPTLRTRFAAFDTSLTDLTPFLHDPVEILFGVQLGGGTDIAAALAWCRTQIDRPRRSVLVLISDLFEGGDGETMRRRVAEMVASGVTVIVLLALADDGAPAHDHDHAAALAAVGARVLAATPDEFPDLLADALA